MKKLKLTFLAVSLGLISLGLTGCASPKKKNISDDNVPTTSLEEDEELDSEGLKLNADSDSGNAGDLQTVNFGFDSSTLSSSAKATLEKNAEILRNNKNVQVQIEGHCDERGSVEYNLALGERRAQSVKNYLLAQGVDRNQLSTISYGKERPMAFGHDESSWSQNRRANFVIIGL